jgi:gamma-glutamyltranspeptidase/glutathione hydrolase
MQPQGHVQVLLNILRGWSPQDALDAPRFCISAGLPDAPIKDAHSAGDINSEVYFEPGIPEEVVSKLRGVFYCTVPVGHCSSSRYRDGARRKASQRHR